MADAGASLWISQADSDLWAAARLYDPGEARSYCQAISKYQQTVEKSVKAIAAGMRDRFIVSIPIGYKHDAARIASALSRPTKPADPTDIQHHVNKVLTKYTIREIKELEALVPHRPPPGSLHARNTEYPFETIAGSWTTPALRNSFSINDVERFKTLAEHLFTSAKEIVSALRR